MTSAAAEAEAATPEVTLQRLKTPPRATAVLEPFLSEEKLTEIIQVRGGVRVLGSARVFKSFFYEGFLG